MSIYYDTDDILVLPVIKKTQLKIQNRINNPEKIDVKYIVNELGNDKHVIVQFSDNTYSDKILKELNTICEKFDKSFGVRFYGHYSSSFDFLTLKKLPNIKCLYVDCLTKVDNFEHLSELQNLEMLSVGYYELKETEFLSFENLKKLSVLYLTETKTKALNLEYLKDYENLEFLILGGHSKNINSLGNLSKLETLYLNSIKKVPLDFINNLGKLKTLKFILGGRESILEINKNRIEHLEITRVRSFDNISNISNFTELKSLVLEDNIKLKAIEFNNEFSKLTDLKIINCKTFNSLAGLEKLTSLNSLTIYKTDLDFEKIINSELPEKLNTFVFCTTKAKVDKKIKQLLSKMDIKQDKLLATMAKKHRGFGSKLEVLSFD